MKKVLFRGVSCLLLVSLFLWARPVKAAGEEGALSYCAILRDRPFYEGQDIGSMADGTGIRVLGQEGDFYKVDCYDMEGYVAKEQVAEKNGSFYICCDPASSETEVMTYTPASGTLQLRQNLLSQARAKLGAPYIYGSDGPWGFDCSGLTSYLYGSCGILLGRRASLQMADGIIVAKSGIQVGDLLFFKTPGETALVSHVGIYIGENRMIHAGSTGVCDVELTGEYFEDYFLCARRIIFTETVQPTPGSRLPLLGLIKS